MVIYLFFDSYHTCDEVEMVKAIVVDIDVHHIFDHTLFRHWHVIFCVVVRHRVLFVLVLMVSIWIVLVVEVVLWFHLSFFFEFVTNFLFLLEIVFLSQ
jgi:hypothetical protein